MPRNPLSRIERVHYVAHRGLLLEVDHRDVLLLDIFYFPTIILLFQAHLREGQTGKAQQNPRS